MKKYLATLLFTCLMLTSVVSYSAPPISCSAVQMDFLNDLKEQHIPVSIFLINGIKLQGRISDYGCDVIKLFNTSDQMVFIHAISTIVPASLAE